MPRPKNVPKAVLPITFEHGPDFVTAVIHVGESTIGVRFESPEQLLMFSSELVEHATQVWPDNEWIKMYLEE